MHPLSRQLLQDKTFWIMDKDLTHKAPPIICSRRQFKILPLFQKLQIRHDFHENRLLMNYHTLFFLKIGKDVEKFVVCCSRVWRFKG